MSDFTLDWQRVSSLLETAHHELSESGKALVPPREVEEQFLEFLEHNELELAWDVLAELGGASGRRSFWLQLARAAEAMKLSDRAAEASRRALLAA